MATIAVLGTLDTKGREHAFVAEKIRSRGHRTLLIDVGTGEPPTVAPDISREAVAKATGADLAKLFAERDRGACVSAMAKAAARLLEQLRAAGRIDGVISLGGGGGTAIASAAMPSAVCWARSAIRSTQRTVAPSWAKSWAMAAPLPIVSPGVCPAPTTTTILPATRLVISCP